LSFQRSSFGFLDKLKSFVINTKVILQVKENGKGGIRTLGSLAATPVFKTGAIDQLCHLSKSFLQYTTPQKLICQLLNKAFLPLIFF
jgi:hypothetical protein